MEFSDLGLFAVIANEFANGDVDIRPWGVTASRDEVLAALSLSLANRPYLLFRNTRRGGDEKAVIRAYAYLLLCALNSSRAEEIADLFLNSVFGRYKEPIPDNIKMMLVMPILQQLHFELMNVCASDCLRISSDSRVFDNQKK